MSATAEVRKTGEAMELLTSREAAQLLRLSRAHLTHVLQGKVRGLPPLPSVQIGRRRLIRRIALLKWVEQIESASVPSNGQGPPPPAKAERGIV